MSGSALSVVRERNLALPGISGTWLSIAEVHPCMDCEVRLFVCAQWLAGCHPRMCAVSLRPLASITRYTGLWQRLSGSALSVVRDATNTSIAGGE